MVELLQIYLQILCILILAFKKKYLFKKNPLCGNPAICRKSYYAQKDMGIEQKFYRNILF